MAHQSAPKGAQDRWLASIPSPLPPDDSNLLGLNRVTALGNAGRMDNHSRRRFLAWSVVLFTLVACAEPPQPGGDAPTQFTTRVIRVADGDSVSVTLGRETVRIRLWGIDAPESDQPWGEEATERATEALLGERVEFIWHDTDRYGRRVCEIILPDGENFNETLVREGLAWWYRYFAPEADHLREAQLEAMEARRGIWKDPGPVAPWDWRRRDRDQPDLPARESLDGSGLEEAAPDADAVFITDTGARYHREGCRHLVSRNRLTLPAAQALGYEPCRVCHPPE